MERIGRILERMDQPIVDVYLDAARAVVDVVASAELSAQWDSLSALEGYSVGGLVAHLFRAVTTVDGYLERPAGRAPDVDAAGYIVSALGDADPVDSALHETIRQRSGDMAAHGPTDLMDAARAALDRVSGRLPAVDTTSVITVLDGMSMSIGEYLRTRVVELCVHADDLEASADDLDLTMPEPAWQVAAAVVARVAEMKLGSRGFAVALTRRERSERPLAL